MNCIDFMTNVFAALHQHNISPAAIRKLIRSVPEVKGLKCLLQTMKQVYGMDIIIVSDSNSVFIDEWLKEHRLHELFLEVFANPAQFKANGRLEIQPYHCQTECSLNGINMCKGKVLEEFVEARRRQNVVYSCIIYLGDGNNDFCPALRLQPHDIVAARKGFNLEKLLCEHAEKLDAQLILWWNGIDLKRQLERMLGICS